MDAISFDQWLGVELKTAKIVEAEDIERKDKLYKLQIELGDAKRQLVAGLKEYYSKEELVGKTIVIVANLEPAKIGGVESMGMLLAVEGADGNLALLTTDKEIESGKRIE